MGKEDKRREELASLKRIEGQIRGIQNMIEDRRHCIEVLTQIHSVFGAIKRVEKKIFQTHLNECMYNMFKQSDKKKREKILIEMTNVMQRCMSK